MSEQSFISLIRPADSLEGIPTESLAPISLGTDANPLLLLLSRSDGAIVQGADPSTIFTMIADSVRKASIQQIEVSKVQPDVVSALDADETALCRLVLPSFVKRLFKALKVSPKDDLIVVPFCDNMVLAGKSSSPMSCCILGDMSDPSSNDEVDSYVTSVPYSLKELRTESDQTAFEMLARGESPVVWERYPYHGPPPFFSAINPSDGKIRFPVPESSEANQYLMMRGKKLSCCHCAQIKPVSVCSACLGAWYCSPTCQKTHWKVHKGACKRKDKTKSEEGSSSSATQQDSTATAAVAAPPTDTATAAVETK